MSTGELTSLSNVQRDVLREFYSVAHTKVVLNKKERKQIWNDFKFDRKIPEIELQSKCPALLSEIQKALQSDHKVQSAVFSECSYSQTLANMLGLVDFFSIADSPNCIDKVTGDLISDHKLIPRYLYKSSDSSRILIQAGGSGGVDSALVSLLERKLIAIEFKEPNAKTSELDLPQYGEDGLLVASQAFVSENPQFIKMYQEQIEKKLNFIEIMGSNMNDFSDEGIEIAVSENYSSAKFADVICVEDKKGYLTMIPAHQAGRWAATRGEIRPAGRNHYEVSTPKFLRDSIIASGGQIDGENAKMPEVGMTTSKKRGGDNSVSRFKINPLFFIRHEDVAVADGFVNFNINQVRQLRPTISAHMNFKKLEISKVHDYYKPEL